MSNSQARHPEPGASEPRVGDRLVAVLPELISHVARETTRTETAERIAREFVLGLGAATARVYLMCPDGCGLSLAAAENIDAPLSHAHVVRLDDEFPASVAARSGVLHLVVAADARFFGRSPAPGGVVVAIPLFAGAETIGAVVAGFDAPLPCRGLSLTPLSHALGALLDRARLRGAFEELEIRARVREERTALIVHDLRQPLQGILLGAAGIARRGSAAEQRALERLRTCSLYLNRMISDLCDTAVLESGSFDLRRVSTDVVALLTTVAREHMPAASIAVLGDLPPVVVDPQRVEQIVVNLLWSAGKYGSGDGEATIAIVRHDDQVIVSITGAGGGIAPGEREHVFEARYREGDRDAGASGLGLGLYICRRLVEEHGGHIWTDGDGSETRFNFSLPIDASATNTNGASRRAREESVPS